jgi:hypothetical protein
MKSPVKPLVQPVYLPWLSDNPVMSWPVPADGYIRVALKRPMRKDAQKPPRHAKSVTNVLMASQCWSLLQFHNDVRIGYPTNYGRTEHVAAFNEEGRAVVVVAMGWLEPREVEE